MEGSIVPSLLFFRKSKGLSTLWKIILIISGIFIIILLVWYAFQVTILYGVFKRREKY
ncbi:MAG: hypothetical protein QMD36_02915 [Candidatus Aenigmarchaeota archaeon]|nr:hypothetical protein [Candidatus Aenigmarchaeota archaeon]